MADSKTIKTFTAIDIEKYHKGQLSAGEMHAMEKAALDDPFLADALEGYAAPGVNVSSDIAELKKRLAAKTEKNKVVPFTPPARSFPWLRAAAMLVLVAGAAFAVYRLAFTEKQEKIAQAKEDSRKKTPVAADTSTVLNPANTINRADTVSQQKENAATGTPVSTESTTSAPAAKQQQKDIAPGENADTKTISPPVTKEEQEIQNSEKRDSDIALLSKQAALKKRRASEYASKPDTTGQGTIAGFDKAKNQEQPAGRQYKVMYDHYKLTDDKAPRNLNQEYPHTNVFRGRVTDAHNNALPFANITNTIDNVGTYADARGNFTLISPDSVLNVQVRSLGFENNIVQLQNKLPANQVVMQEDNNSLAEVVISSRRVNSSRSRSATMILEEPEPVDGWTNYDTYLANNLIMPETVQTKPIGGEVELSFEVNNNGEPTNITVEKSLCESCDKEAIRLIREGPKWKRKTSKGRTFVTIPF